MRGEQQERGLERDRRSATREIGSITTEPPAVAAPTSAEQGAVALAVQLRDDHRQRRVGRQAAAEAGDDADQRGSAIGSVGANAPSV